VPGQLSADAPELTPAFAEFAQLQRRMTKVVFSNTMQPGDGRIVIRGDLAGCLVATCASAVQFAGAAHAPPTDFVAWTFPPRGKGSSRSIPFKTRSTPLRSLASSGAIQGWRTPIITAPGSARRMIKPGAVDQKAIRTGP
jgi:hypothetical protein